jgi:hypothetical protein
MRTIPLVGSLIGLLAAAVPAEATFIKTRMAITEMVGGADVIVIGKVARIHQKLVQALPTAGAHHKESYQVINVAVQEALLGAKGLTSLKVGAQCFVAKFGRGPQKPVPSINFAVGEEACFFLRRHPGTDFYDVGFDGVLRQKEALGPNANYAEDLEQTRRCVKLLADPEKGLTSDKEGDKLLTVAFLIRKYRGPAPTFLDQKNPARKSQKQQPISAEQSKKILHVLVEADWSLAKEPMPGILHPASLFKRLGLTARDGWTLKQKQVSPFDGRGGFAAHQELTRAAKKWLKTHADTYRIKRLADDRAGKGDRGQEKASNDDDEKPVKVRKKKGKPDAEVPEKTSGGGHDTVRATAKLKLIKMLIDDGKTERARFRLKELIKAYPDTEAAAEARKLLKKLD